MARHARITLRVQRLASTTSYEGTEEIEEPYTSSYRDLGLAGERSVRSNDLMLGSGFVAQKVRVRTAVLGAPRYWRRRKGQGSLVKVP